jgi:hypothetical protein
MAAFRTPGARFPLLSGEARHAGEIDFVHQVVNIFAIFPLTHALVVMSPQAALSHAVRIVDEDLRDAIDLAEADACRVPLCRRWWMPRSERAAQILQASCSRQ